MSDRMCGVVLWADAMDRKAVIWCEDHGDLAYYHDEDATAHDGVSLDAGDLVEFDLTHERNLRLASNPQRLLRSSHTGLPTELRAAASHRSEPRGQVIRFPRCQQRRALSA